MKSATDVTQKWVTKTGASSGDYIAGIKRVTQNPAAAASAKADQWQQKMAQPKTKQRFQSGLNQVTLQSWQQAAVDKGASRLSSGAQQGAQKYQAFATAFLPFLDTGVAQVKAMPKITLDDGINRATAMIRYNATFKR